MYLLGNLVQGQSAHWLANDQSNFPSGELGDTDRGVSRWKVFALKGGPQMGSKGIGMQTPLPGESPMNEISTLMKETPQGSLAPSTK